MLILRTRPALTIRMTGFRYSRRGQLQLIDPALLFTIPIADVHDWEYVECLVAHFFRCRAECARGVTESIGRVIITVENRRHLDRIKDAPRKQFVPVTDSNQLTFEFKRYP